MPSLFRQISVGISRWWNEAIVDKYRLFGANVHGIEVTQAIQYYRANEHLTDAADRGPDNTVELVAYKAAWVRVYVRAGIFVSLDNVSGTLEVKRRIPGFLYIPVATHAPQPPGFVTAEQSVNYNTERSNIGRTLNFIIPAEQFHGTLELTVKLAGLGSSGTTIYVAARRIQTLRVRAILVSYNGPSTSAAPPPGGPPVPNLTLAAPTLADLQSTAALALAMMPVQATGSFAAASTIPWNLPLDDMRNCPGCCSNNWDALLLRLTTERTNDGNRADVVYYGLLPAGIPLNVPGCGQGGLGSAAVNDRSTFVHEIGHGYGFIHTPCGNAGGTDANYPTYEPYGSASIGEYGLDIRNGNTFDPNTARDYMSYCNPTWMSLYQHRRLIGHARLDPRWINEAPWWHEYYEVNPFVIPELWLPDPPPYEVNVHSNPVLNPVVSILGEVLENGDVKVISVARVRAAGHPGGVDTRFMAQLVGERGDVLARAPLVRLDTHGGCGCQEGGAPKDPNRLPLRFQAFVPDVAPGAALRIVDAATELWVRKAPVKAVAFARAKADVAGAEGIVLRWELHASGETDVWAQWSNNEGKTWHGLATGLTSKASRGEATVPLTGLPAGPVFVRLLAHDGFFTAVSETLSVALPPRAPELALLHPRDRQLLTENRPLQLAASATDSAGVPIPNEELRWSLDGAPVGHGREVWIKTPPAGEHTVVLTVRWSGGEVQRKATIRIERSPEGRPPERRG